MAGTGPDRRTLADAALRGRPTLRRAMTGTADRAEPAQSADAAAAAWEDPPRVERTDTAPVLAVDGFAGPLDWWLDLARAQKIDFASISIATLIGAFATALETALAKQGEIRLEHW